MNSVTSEIESRLVNLLKLNSIVKDKDHGWKKASIELRKAMVDFEKHGVEFRKQLIEEQKQL